MTRTDRDTERDEALRSLCRDLHKLVLFHKELGLSHYPAPLISQPPPPAPAPEQAPERERETSCSGCPLEAARERRIFGAGNPQAVLALVGEWPGPEDETEGRPFGGEAGRLLARMLEANELRPEDVYLTYAVKCRTPGGNPPDPETAAACLAILRRELAAIDAKLICAMGPFAAQTLLGSSDTLLRLRGRWHRLGSIPVLPTFHPSYLILHPAMKKAAWQDLQELQRRYRRLTR